jgi:hypothetical protein
MLVEVLVASIVSLVIGFLIYTVFLMYSNQSNQSISAFLMQQQYDNVSHQLARDVRKASFVLESGETPSAHGAGYDTVSSIVLADNSGIIVAQYAISGSQFLEGTQQSPYQAGGGTIQLVPGGSRFIVAPQRKQVEILLALSRKMGTRTYTVSPRKDVFLCRN